MARTGEVAENKARAMIDQVEAITIARLAADKEGWAFAEPVVARLRRPWFGRGGRWEIWTNGVNRGTRARFVIDLQDGRVIEKGYLPR